MSRKSSICPPQIPERPSSEADKIQRASFCMELRILGNKLRQRNLDNAVKLAIEAAQGRGELVEHFAELGRCYGDRTDTLPRHKKAEAFRIIPGGLSCQEKALTAMEKGR